MFTIGYRKVFAHRMAYAIAHGDIPGGLLIRHTCDNPACVNPSHLVLGTDRDNVHDAMARGRRRIAA